LLLKTIIPAQIKMSNIILHLFSGQFVAALVNLLASKTEENANVKT